MPLPPVYTADLFRPLHRELMRVLRSLSTEDWSRPTVAGAWTVKDLAAHLLDGQVRRLSFQRDGAPMPDPGRPIRSPGALLDFLNALNAEWVQAFRRVGPGPLVSMLDAIGPQVASFFEALDPHEDAFFAVDWAGETRSENWMDVGREFTELWHHQAQIRMAVGAEPLDDDRWLSPLHQLSVRALPSSLGRASAEAGETVVLEIEGAGAGVWSLSCTGGDWVFLEERPSEPDAHVVMEGVLAWRIFFNAVSPENARGMVQARGNPRLVERLLRTRSVMVAGA